MNSFIIHDNIHSLIHKKCHPKSHHSDIKYHMTLNITFSVAIDFPCSLICKIRKWKNWIDITCVENLRRLQLCYLRVTSHMSQEPWPWNCESPKEKCPKVAVPRHLQNHILVWSRTLEYSLKSYVTGPSTKCYFNKFLFMHALIHDRIE
jgi:hypothetical protein